MKDKLIIFGCGGHAKAVLDVILYNSDYKDIIFVDENAKENEKILNFPVLKDYSVTDERVFVAIGDNNKRTKICEKYYKNLISIISKNAYIGQNVQIGKGVFIAHHAHVGIFSQIQDFCIVNTSASIDHECKIEKSSFIAPNVTLCGNVHIKKNTFIGVGASVIERIKIAESTIIGAGAIVVDDITENGTYIGCPAKKFNKV